MEQQPVLLSDGEIVDLYFAIDSKISEYHESADVFAGYFDEQRQRDCLLAADRLRAIRAKLSETQAVLRKDIPPVGFGGWLFPPSSERR